MSLLECSIYFNKDLQKKMSLFSLTLCLRYGKKKFNYKVFLKFSYVVLYVNLDDSLQMYFLHQNQNTGELTSVTNMCKMRALHCLLELRQDEVVQKLCGRTIEDLR